MDAGIFDSVTSADAGSTRVTICTDPGSPERSRGHERGNPVLAADSAGGGFISSTAVITNAHPRTKGCDRRAEAH